MSTRIRRLLAVYSPPEKKYVDTRFTGGATSTAGTFILLNSIAAGASVSDRVGRKITMKDILIKINTTIIGAAIGNQVFRAFVVYDAQTNATTPTLTDILQSAATGATAVISPMNLANRDRFRILAEKTIVLSANTETERAIIKFYRKNMKLDTIYNSALSAVGAISSGSLYLVVHALQNDPASIFDFDCRVRYIDN